MPYDVIVIGSGPGGYSAAIRAGQYGLKTALVEKQAKLGGTCLLVGCIPTKSLLHTADVWEHFVHSDAEGIHAENTRLEYPKIKDRKDGIVNKHANGVAMLLKRAKVDRITGYATLKGGGKIEVKSDAGVQTLETKNIIIATGSEARMIPGLQPDPEVILTNIEILDLTAIPKSLIVIGAGAVGVEFASIFKRFGTDVTIIEMLPRVVPVEDEDVSKELERLFKKQKIRVETGARAENIQKTGKGVKLTLITKDGKQEQLEAEKLLVAVGRKPNSENIGLENTKVQLDRGFIKTDKNQQTDEPGVYAIGDVVAGTPQPEVNECKPQWHLITSYRTSFAEAGDKSESRSSGECAPRALLVGETVLASTQLVMSRRRSRIARPARTKNGPPPLTRQACSVRTERLRTSAVCTSVRSASGSVGL